MKVKYDSIWSKIYKFTSGDSNQEMTTEPLVYWFTIMIGIIALPITILSKLFEWIVPGTNWSFSQRVFAGLLVWCLIACGVVIVWSANLAGQIVILWSYGMAIVVGLMLCWLLLIKFPGIMGKVKHLLYLFLTSISWVMDKLKLNLILEYDEVEVYIVFDLNYAHDFDKLKPVKMSLYKICLLYCDYDQILEGDYTHIILTINDCNIEEYLNNNYMVFKGIAYGKEIIKLERYKTNTCEDINGDSGLLS